MHDLCGERQLFGFLAQSEVSHSNNTTTTDGRVEGASVFIVVALQRRVWNIAHSRSPVATEAERDRSSWATQSHFTNRPPTVFGEQQQTLSLLV